MTRTRTVMIGKCTVVIENVPDNITDSQLKYIAFQKLLLINKENVIKEVSGLNKAS